MPGAGGSLPEFLFLRRKEGGDNDLFYSWLVC